MANEAWGVGASLLRREDERHLHGRGEFVSHIKLPGTMEVAFLRSPHAHAWIKSIAVPPEAAGRVFTAADLPQVVPVRVVTQASGAKSPAWPPLAVEKVRYVGEAIAACIAPIRGEAEDLAASIIVEYQVLDAVVDPVRDMHGIRIVPAIIGNDAAISLGGGVDDPRDHFALIITTGPNGAHVTLLQEPRFSSRNQFSPPKRITRQEEWRGDPADLALLQNRCQGSATGSRRPPK
jgi:hypothetical protein